MYKKIAQLTVIFLILAAVSCCAAPLLRVTYLDVNQGDCVIVRTAQKTIMIDAGDDNRNAAQQYIIPYLKREGIKKIDQAIISHPHRDHFGGFLDVLRSYPIGEFIYSNDSNVSSDREIAKPANKPGQDGVVYAQLKELINQKGIAYRRAVCGETLDWGQDVKAEVLYCEQQPNEAAPWVEAGKNANNTSLVIKLTAGSTSFLFTGDAEKEVEAAIIRKCGKKLKCDVLKSGHHGSKTSSSHAFMDIAQPTYGIISCGKGNPFGHPTQVVLDIYDYLKMKVFRTDIDGTVECVSDGKTLKFVSNNSKIEFEKKPKIISLTANSVTLQWSTNRAAAAAIHYKAGSAAAKTKTASSEAKTQTITLTGLKPNTAYTYKIEAQDPREAENAIISEGAFTTPEGSGMPLPKITSMATNFDKLYMRHPFKVLFNVENTAETAAKEITLELFHSSMNNENSLGKVNFQSLSADSVQQAVFPVEIDWLGEVELIAVLKQGKDIIDTNSLQVNLNAKLIMVDCAHGCKDYYTGRFAGMKMDIFRHLGMQMKSISKPITYEMVKDAFVIIFPHPKTAYTAKELNALKKFVSCGGSLLFYGKSDYKDYSHPEMFNAVLEAVGSKIRFNDDQFCDPSDNIGPPYRPFVTTFPTPAITGKEVKKLLLRDCQSLISHKNTGLKGLQNLFLIATGDDDSYNSDADENNDAYIYADHTPKLPVPIAACEDLGLGRIGCVGENLYQDAFYTSPGDLSTVPFNRNLIYWLSVSRDKSLYKLVKYAASLDDEDDAEIRAMRYESISAEILKSVSQAIEYSGDSCLNNVKKVLSKFDKASAVKNLKRDLMRMRQFRNIYSEY